jgi:hypothetical protein
MDSVATGPIKLGSGKGLPAKDMQQRPEPTTTPETDSAAICGNCSVPQKGIIAALLSDSPFLPGRNRADAIVRERNSSL